MNKKSFKKLSDEKIAECISTLNDLVENDEQLAHLTDEERIALMTAAGKLSRPHKQEIIKRLRNLKEVERQVVIQKERQARSDTGIRKAREASVFSAPKQIADPTDEVKPKN